MLEVLNSYWKYDKENHLGIYMNEDGKPERVFKLERSDLETIKSTFASEEKKSAKRYVCKKLVENVKIPLGVIKACIKLEEQE